MSFQWVDHARLYPARCAVLPQLGGNDPRGYIDTGTTTMSGERVYVSVVAAELMAEGIGFVRPGDARVALPAEVKGELVYAGQEIRALRDEVTKLKKAKVV